MAATDINASWETVWALLVDKIEHPYKYISAIKKETVHILSRGPEGTLREMSMPNGTVYRELITADEATGIVKFALTDPTAEDAGRDLINNSFSGYITNELTGPRDGSAPLRLLFDMFWEGRTEESRNNAASVKANFLNVAGNAVKHTKDIAEGRVTVE
eukprot:GILI01023087.1.p1 GENE.GILI01023087.1~~GILI01023087.1.p1  ORF type:complete len:171 (+),score=54.35 GILI01023087.1:39-515(+)